MIKVYDKIKQRVIFVSAFTLQTWPERLSAMEGCNTMKRLIASIIDLDHHVTIYQTSKNRFTVSYGLQVRKGLTYIEAAHEFGECVMHSATCAGRVA